MTNLTDRAALQRLMDGDPDLDKLEQMLDRFNLFEAIGVVRQELRHSHLLAFLLNPRQNHGLGDAFAKSFLQSALDSASPPLPTGMLRGADAWSLDKLQVRREWRNIDILLLDEANELAIIIENKIDSHEHSDQLDRYWNDVAEHYSGYHQAGLYLTPAGEPPTHCAYRSVGYGEVCAQIEHLAESEAPRLSNDVRTLLTHYAQMLRRHIVEDSEIAELCRRFYRRHQRALDLVYQHRPDPVARVRDTLEGLVRERPDLILDSSTKNTVRFLPAHWDTPDLKVAQGWTPSKRVLLLELWSPQTFDIADHLLLVVTLGPSRNSELRRRVVRAAETSPSPFTYSGPLSERHLFVFQRRIPLVVVESRVDGRALEEHVREQLETFVEHDLPMMTERLRSVRVLN